MNCKNFHLDFDMNYRHKIGEIPFLNIRVISCDQTLFKKASECKIEDNVKVYKGRIATGSEFLNSDRKTELKSLWEECGNPLCAEMEGFAIAQICSAFKIPFLLLRSISDEVNGNASKDFHEFIKHAAKNLFPVVCHLLDK
jgi:adenosylhomocysteine nucleosidase